MKKKIIAVLISAALIGGLCGCNGGNEDTSANVESDTVTATATEAETSAAEKDTETETEEPTEAAEDAAPNAEGLTVSPNGYVLDPKVTLGGENAWDFPENQPCLIGEPVEGVRFYGVNAGEERSYKYTLPAFGESEYSQYIIIEQGGIAEEFAGVWSERFGTVMSFYSADFDGDGETEIATERYSVGGTFCCVMELAVYKEKDGRYQRFLFDNTGFNDEYINVKRDNEKNIMTFSVKDFDKTFEYDFSEIAKPDGGCGGTLEDVCDFAFDGGEITYIVSPILYGDDFADPVDIRLRLDFSGGVFTCSDVEFTEREF